MPPARPAPSSQGVGIEQASPARPAGYLAVFIDGKDAVDKHGRRVAPITNEVGTTTVRDANKS